MVLFKIFKYKSCDKIFKTKKFLSNKIKILNEKHLFLKCVGHTSMVEYLCNYNQQQNILFHENIPYE